MLIVYVIAQRWVPETRDPDAPPHFDVVGATLAVAGVTFQTLLRNPLAEPYLLGVSNGAAV